MHKGDGGIVPVTTFTKKIISPTVSFAGNAISDGVDAAQIPKCGNFAAPTVNFNLLHFSSHQSHFPFVFYALNTTLSHILPGIR